MTPQRLALAARAFVDRVDEIEGSLEMRAVYGLAAVHGCPYAGETWRAERDELLLALAEVEE